MSDKTYKTLGSIAEELKVMKAQGVTRGAVLYALDRVFWEDPPEESQIATRWQRYRQWRMLTGGTMSYMDWVRQDEQ